MTQKQWDRLWTAAEAKLAKGISKEEGIRIFYSIGVCDKEGRVFPEHAAAVRSLRELGEQMKKDGTL